MPKADIHTRKWNAFRQKVFAIHGHVCHLCGHDGARQVDHVIPRHVAPGLFWDLTNMRPAHGTGNPCPVCGKHCNQARTRAAAPVRDASPAAETAGSWECRQGCSELCKNTAPHTHYRVW